VYCRTPVYPAGGCSGSQVRFPVCGFIPQTVYVIFATSLWESPRAAACSGIPNKIWVSSYHPFFSFHRRSLYKKDDKADMLVQLYLSLFSLNNIILIVKKVSREGTFASIVSPRKDDDRVSMLMGLIKDRLPDLLHRYPIHISRTPLYQGLVWEPTWKALHLVQEVLMTVLKVPYKRAKAIRSSFLSQAYELASWAELYLRFTHSKGEQSSQGALLIQLISSFLDGAWIGLRPELARPSLLPPKWVCPQ